MKNNIAITALFAIVYGALAIPVGEFKSLSDLTDQSPEIIIARCTGTLDFISASNNATVVVDGMIHSDIEVVFVLKGNSKTGMSQMASQYWPYRGEYFLVLANNEKDQFNSGYTAVERYRVISLSHNFMINQLAGKTSKEQIQLILNSRLKDLNSEIARDNEERQRIESCLDETNRVAVPKTNAPPSKPFSGPGKSF